MNSVSTTKSRMLKLCLYLLIIAGPLLFVTRFALAAQEQAKVLKVGFILVSAANDLGWSQAHDEGRRYLESALKDQVQTIVVENVPENGEAERVMEKMIAQGTRLIFATSYGYLEPAARVAARHPDVVVMQCNRTMPHNLKNMGPYFATQVVLDYIGGVIAAKMTKTGKLGYVGGHPVPFALACLNAYTLGAQSVNPHCKVHIVWVNSWSDPSTEAEAAKSLLDSGVDVINSQLSSSITVSKATDRLGAYSIGHNADLNRLFPKSWLVGVCMNWGPLYTKIAKSVINHTWVPDDTLDSMKDGYVKLSSLGNAIPNSVRKEALSLEKSMNDGTFVVFKGPLKDRDGKMRVPAGKQLDQASIIHMDWLVPGVEGALPSK